MLEFLDEHVSFSCEFIRTDRLNSISGGSYWDTSTAPTATKNTLFGSWTVMGDTRTPIVGFKLALLDSYDLLVSGKVFVTKMICICDFLWRMKPPFSRENLWAIIITKNCGNLVISWFLHSTHIAIWWSMCDTYCWWKRKPKNHL